MSADVKLTKAMLRWLAYYRPMRQNNVYSPTDTVWTRRNGATMPGLVPCREAYLITSGPDDLLHVGGWRHDLTPTGRLVVSEKWPLNPAEPALRAATASPSSKGFGSSQEPSTSTEKARADGLADHKRGGVE